MAYLDKLEQILYKAIDKLSMKMIKLCEFRIPKIQNYYKPLPPSAFKNDGSIIMKSTLFISLINNFNHIINLNYKGHKIIQIKSNYKFLMITLNAMNKHVISTQVNKMKIINFMSHTVRYDINKENTYYLAKDAIKIIGDCMVLNPQAYNYYFKIHNAWNLAHNSQGIKPK